MMGAEKISESEFRQIMQSDLVACSQAYEAMSEYTLLKRQRLQLVVITLIICGLIVAMIALSLVDLSGWRWVGLLLAASMVGILLVLRANTQLQRSLRNTRMRWEQAQLQKCDVTTMKFATDLAKRVIDYNALVDRLKELQSGDYWQDFRQLSAAEKDYLGSVFVQVRGQLLIALQMCRQMIDLPGSKPVNLLSQQLVARDRELIHEFTAKYMTSNRYLELAKSLTTIEVELQGQVRSVTAQG